MTQTIEKMGLSPLTQQEILFTDGGGKGFWIWLGEQIVDNWDDLKKGIVDGWNGSYNPPK